MAINVSLLPKKEGYCLTGAAEMSAQLVYSAEGEVPAYGHYFENVTNVKELLEQVKSGAKSI